MDELKRDLAQVKKRLTELERHSAQQVKLAALMQEDVQGLLGTFSSIEKHMVTLFERDLRTQARFEQIEARLQAVEKRQPPAA